MVDGLPSLMGLKGQYVSCGCARRGWHAHEIPYRWIHFSGNVATLGIVSQDILIFLLVGFHTPYFVHLCRILNCQLDGVFDHHGREKEVLV